MASQEHLGKKLAPTAAFLLLVVGLVAVNVLFSFLPLRLDVTEEGLFTLSEGSRRIVSRLEEPTTIKLFYSESLPDIPVAFKTYSSKVIELLREFQASSGGMARLEILDPEPDTDEEEWAMRYGLSPARLPSGTNLFFGMVALSADREATVPFFDPRREKFLEYDIAQTFVRVNQEQKKKVGVLSFLPIGGYGNPMVPNRGPQDWVIMQELQKNYEIEMIPPDTVAEIDSEIGLVLLVHPKFLPERISYALDQFLLRGGKLMVFVDPNSREDSGGQGQYGSPTNSDLKTLFEAWGVKYNNMEIVGDHQLGTKVSTSKFGVVDYPVWLTVKSGNMARDQVITSELEEIFLADPGSFAVDENFPYTFTPLISSSEEAGMVDFTTVRMMGPASLAKMVKSGGKSLTLSALITGTFKTAYPGGPPPTPKEPEGQNPDAPKKPPLLRKLPHLSEGEKETTVILVGDSDFMADRFSVEAFNFLGNQVIRPRNDNLNFVLNSVEFLTGSQDLIHIRSRGKFSRPFDRVESLQVKAAERYRREEEQLSAQLEEVKRKLANLEEDKPQSGSLIVSRDQLDAVRKFRLEEQRTRKALKDVRKVLRQDIESLGNTLLMVNLLLVPLLVSVAGFYFIYTRTTRSGGKR